jgi:hypothetical protein
MPTLPGPELSDPIGVTVWEFPDGVNGVKVLSILEGSCERAVSVGVGEAGKLAEFEAVEDTGKLGGVGRLTKETGKLGEADELEDVGKLGGAGGLKEAGKLVGVGELDDVGKLGGAGGLEEAGKLVGVGELDDVGKLGTGVVCTTAGVVDGTTIGTVT